jgi:hypothetical protein
MLANLPPAPPGLIIKEKDDKEIEPPSAPNLTNDANSHDAIEGFRINFQKLSISDDDNKPTTLVLSKEVARDNAPKTDEEAYEMAMSLANSMFHNGRFHYNDNEEKENGPVNMMPKSTSVNTTDSMKRNKEITKQPTPVEYKSPSYSSKSSNNTDTSSPSEKQASKKKRVVLQMSLFGKIWTALDKMSTSNTRQYFKSINGQFKSSNQATWRQLITDENMLVRLQIFSEKIIEWFVKISNILKNFIKTNFLTLFYIAFIFSENLLPLLPV